MKTIKPFEVKIKENHPTEPQTWRVFLDREFTAKLRVIKKDSDTKQTVLVPNAEFKIFNLDKNEYVTQYTTYPSKVKHTSFFTDEDGDLILPEALKIGNYRIEEVSAPYGYVVMISMSASLLILIQHLKQMVIQMMQSLLWNIPMPLQSEK